MSLGSAIIDLGFKWTSSGDWLSEEKNTDSDLMEYSRRYCDDVYTTGNTELSATTLFLEQQINQVRQGIIITDFC